MLTPRETKELRALKLRRNRDASGHFLAEGVRVVEDLLASEIDVRFVAALSSLEDNERGAALLQAAARRGIIVRFVPEYDFFEFAATESPQGVLAVAASPKLTIADFEISAPPAIVLVLDAIQDPGNFGTLVRSAEAFGAAGVIALEGTVDPWNPKAIRSAAGSSFRVPIVAARWQNAREELRSLDFEIIGASMEGRPYKAAGADRLALVVGNEGSGLSEAVRDDLDALVGIPLRGRAESLNVAAAAAILLYEMTASSSRDNEAKHQR